ncbi:SsrA-binding protein SmpB [Candidatus Saccharibacteria bacterium]|jgi:SsrA-binding protein|nr:SsrA-binding protein SmpB [Candidatus Saccharibacteria bacterium]
MAAKKSAPKATAILNRRAKFDYELGDSISTGIVLSGPEVRAVRDGHAQLKGSFVSIKSNELWLNNASFSIKLNEKGEKSKSVDTRPRKLLAKKKEIEQLQSQKAQGFTIVPIKIIPSGRYIKVIIAPGKGKKSYDKRETIKRRQQDRETKRSLKKY